MSYLRVDIMSYLRVDTIRVDTMSYLRVDTMSYLKGVCRTVPTCWGPCGCQTMPSPTPYTQVVTDIIYLRKRAAGEEPRDDSWVESEPIEIKDRYSYYRRDPVWVNRYFIDNPDRVLGKHTSEGSMYRGSDYTVQSTPDKPLPQTLARESAEIARSGGIAARSAVAAAPAATVAAQPAVRGSPKYVVVDGDIRVEHDGKTSAPDLPATAAERVRALVGCGTRLGG